MSVGYRRLAARQRGAFVPPFVGVPDAPFDGMPTLQAWKVDGLPDRWRSKLNRQLCELFAAAPAERDPRAQAIDAAWRRVEAIAQEARGAVLPTNATDEQIQALAATCAKRCSMLGCERVELMRARCDRVAAGVGVVALDEAIGDAGAVARYLDRRWWTRRLREAHGRTIEAAAIGLGLVHKRGDLYVSDENLRRRIQQNKRNAAILASTIATNEDGEQFTLADLAAKSVSNKAIRRGELMLRIRGMEEVAAESGDVALFAVLTCPSRMHAVRESGVANPNHDGTTPRQAQAWHAAQWKLATAALHRLAVRFYGARTVEPHHDGCPHWNVLLFVPAGALDAVEAILRRYWLDAESPDEPGAQAHRVCLTRIDAAKGSATAYIAKYISKGIDGHGMRDDLFGNPIIETSTRIEAWARTWGIRQFQTMCSASVSVWRELRRIKREDVVAADPPDELVIAWNAAQRFGAVEGDEAKRADFAAFIKACGGPRVSRKAAQLALDFKPTEGTTRYGEAREDKPAGVIGKGIVEQWRDFGGIVGRKQLQDRFVAVVVASVRRVWTIAQRSAGVAVGFGLPRTRVNNYTPADLGNVTACQSEVDADDFDIGFFIGADRPPPITSARDYGQTLERSALA